MHLRQALRRTHAKGGDAAAFQQDVDSAHAGAARVLKKCLPQNQHGDIEPIEKRDTRLARRLV